MKVCIVHADRLSREVLTRLLATKMNSEVVGFSCLEDLLRSRMDYDVFVLYNMFGRSKMDRWEGVKWIRNRIPDAFIVTMNYKKFFDRKDSPGADANVFSADEDVDGLIKFIREHDHNKSIPPAPAVTAKPSIAKTAPGQTPVAKAPPPKTTPRKI